MLKQVTKENEEKQNTLFLTQKSFKRFSEEKFPFCESSNSDNSAYLVLVKWICH